LAGIAAGDLVLVVTYGSVVGIVAGVVVAGIGLGVASVAGTAIGTDVDHELAGTATGLLNTGAQLGTALGIAGLLLMAAGLSKSVHGTAVAWATAAGTAAITGLVLATRRDARPASPAPG